MGALVPEYASLVGRHHSGTEFIGEAAEDGIVHAQSHQTVMAQGKVDGMVCGPAIGEGHARQDVPEPAAGLAAVTYGEQQERCCRQLAVAPHHQALYIGKIRCSRCFHGLPFPSPVTGA